MTDKKLPASPVLWHNEDPWEANLSELDVMYDEANSAVSTLHGTSFQPYVDELAILMPNHEMVMEFVTDAVQHGWVYFNNSVDVVAAEPFGTTYEVQYHFLRHNDKPWRLEVMRKTGGISPLHDTLSRMALSGFPVVHASFKEQTAEDYAVAQAILNEGGYTLAQECVSTYGRFGYWRRLASPQAFYLKPRINTRDAVRGYGKLRTPAEVLAGGEEFRG